jgi:hypothetical protein
VWLGWGDEAEYFRESGMKYGTTELMVPAVGKPQKHSTAATPSPTSFRELMRALDIVPRQSEMPQLTSRQGSSQMRLGSEKPQGDNHIVPPMPTAVSDSSLTEIGMSVQPGTFYPCIMRPYLIIILISDSDENIVMAPASPDVLIAQLVFLTRYLV